MYTNLDNIIKIFIASKPSNVIYYAADFSIINTPILINDALNLSKNLYNTNADRHVALLLQRSKRKYRINTVSNISCFTQWNFLDTVSIVYEKASSCSNNGLLPVSESANILYKGTKPDVSSTNWFNSDKKNASNFWDLGVREEELQYVNSCYHNKFSWELMLLMYSIASPLIYREFIYTGVKILPNEMLSLIAFCKHMQMSCQIVLNTEDEAKKMIKIYKEMIKK